MTPEQIEIHRKRFEELYMPRFGWNGCFEKHIDGGYAYSDVQTGFDCYLLCAQNLEVELPSSNSAYDVLVDYKRKVIEFLESQGINIK